jgi:hypothetical protein
MLRFASRATSLFLVALCINPVTARAQVGAFGSGTAVGVTVQAISTEDGFVEVPAVELHITSIRPSGFALDVGLATLPSALAAGFFLIAPDLGVGRVLPVGGGALILKGGPSAVLVGSGAGGGGAVGIHVGAAALVRLGPRAGLRLEVVPRFYAFGGGGFQLTTFGIGLTSLPDQSR